MKKKVDEFQVARGKVESRSFSGIGDRCKERRGQLNVSRSAIAERVGVSLSTLQAWENKEREPSASDIILLANALDVAPGWLLTGEIGIDESTLNQDVQGPIDDSQQADQVLKHLTKSQKDILVAAIIQVGVSGIINSLGKTELNTAFSLLPDVEKERLMRLHEEIKKGAPEDSDLTEQHGPDSEHKRAG